MRKGSLLLALLGAPALAPPVLADEPGDFDYYVLALSWSPTWCLLEGDERGSPQCDEEADFGWVLHGLWPQHEAGWPSWCDAPRDPSRAETAAMADVMGTDGLAWHAWEKHGTCSGLDPRDYFALAREAFDGVAVPPGFATLAREVGMPVATVEEAFLRMNPSLAADGLTVTCREGRIQEVRVCLTADLEPRRCGDDVLRDCRGDALLAPIP